MSINPSQQTDPLRKQALWVVGWRMVGILTTLAANILAARLLGPAEFGIYLLVLTVVALGGLLGTAGLNEAGLRFISHSLALHQNKRARAYLRQVLTIVGIASLAAAAITVLGMYGFQWRTGRFHDPTLLVVLTAIGVVALSWQQISAESLRGYGNLRLASLFSGGQTGGPVSNLLLLAGFGIAWSAAVNLNANWAVALTVISLVLTFPLALKCAWGTSQFASNADTSDSPELSYHQSRELVLVGGALLLNQVLAFASQQLDIWLGGALLSPDELGLYGAAKRSLLLAAMPVQMAMMTVVATIPRLHAQARTQELERVLRTASNFAAVPAMIALVLLGLFPDLILRLIFGGSYTGAAPTVLVLISGYLVLVLLGNPPHVLTMTGKHRTVLVVNAISAVVLLVAGAVGARWYGAPGLAAGSSLSFAFQNGTLWWLARKQIGVWTHVGMSSQVRSSKVPIAQASPPDVLASSSV